VISMNVLASPHTRHNSEFHRQQATESPDQRAARFALNINILDDLSRDSPAALICLQEADAEFVKFLLVALPRFVVSCQILNRSSEGTCVLADKTTASAISSTTAIGLDAGKTAASVLLQPPAVNSPIWVSSLHLLGGVGEDVRATRTKEIRSIQADLDQISSVAAVVLCGDWNDAAPSLLDPSLHVLPVRDARLPTTDQRSVRSPPTGLSADFSRGVSIDWVATSAAAVGRISEVLVRHTPANPWDPSAVVGSDHVPLTFTID
jgi:endonuclease/exonuclease/phosphatase family metal-dependent hydrolase